MSGKVTMKDIANKMDISIVSVSKALSGKEGVSEELREEIVKTADKMGYVSKAERKKIEARNPNISIVISERFTSDKAFYILLYQKITEALAEKDFVGILEIIRRDDEKNNILPKSVELGTVEQVIIIGQMSDSYLEKLQSAGVHMVFFDFENEEFDVDCVVTDNVTGGYTMTRYLVKQGYTDIAFVGNYKSTRSILDRMLGYYKYSIIKDHKPDESRIISDRDDEGVPIDLELPDNMPEAFFCNCDEIAYKLIKQLKSMGYRVPEDIAVVGYDDYAPDIPKGVKLTTYRVDEDEMVRACVHIVSEWSVNPDYRRGTTLVHGDLIERETGKRRKQIRKY